MKKTIGLLISLIVMLCILVLPACAGDYPEVEVYINGNILETDQPAIVVNGRTLVPLRAISEALKCDVSWDDENQIAKIENEVVIIKLQINNYTMNILERENQSNVLNITLDMHPVIYNGRTLVPARAISEALHALVEWDEKENAVKITMEFDLIDIFINDFSTVRKNGKWGCINEKREIIVPCEYDEITPMRDNLIYVRKDKKWGCFNSDGKQVIPCIYDEKFIFITNTTMEHMNNRAKVVRDGKWGYVDITGKEIIPCEYDSSEGALAALMGI